jgi:hypothetical protein
MRKKNSVFLFNHQQFDRNTENDHVHSILNTNYYIYITIRTTSVII